MIIGNILIGALLVVLCIAPFAFIAIKKYVKTNSVRNEIFARAQQLTATVKKIEVYKNFAIAIDEASKFLFYKNLEESPEELQAIELRNIASCKVEEYSSGVYIVLRHKSAQTPDRLLQFVNLENHYQLTIDTSVAESWNATIRKALA